MRKLSYLPVILILVARGVVAPDEGDRKSPTESAATSALRCAGEDNTAAKASAKPQAADASAKPQAADDNR